MTKWTIAILTVPERSMDLERITGILERQIAGRTDIEMLIARQDWGIGEKRQWCLDIARGEYFCFVDDDDLVAHDYVDTIYPLLDGVDYVGFRVQHYLNGRKSKPTFHSLRYDGWSEDVDGYRRNVSHLNPIRVEIARQGRFAGDYGEDYAWAQQVHPATEHYVDRPLYFYFDSPEHSASRGRINGNA